jgi:hypothetical protein
MSSIILKGRFPILNEIWSLLVQEKVQLAPTLFIDLTEVSVVSPSYLAPILDLVLEGDLFVEISEADVEADDPIAEAVRICSTLMHVRVAIAPLARG